MNDMPLPGAGPVVAVRGPGNEAGYWPGSPGAALDADGTFVVAYRVRTGVGAEGGAQTVVTRSDDSHELHTELIR